MSPAKKATDRLREMAASWTPLARARKQAALDFFGPEALRVAAAEGNAEIVWRLLSESVDARVADGCGVTALMEAAAADSPDCVELLLPRSDPDAAMGERKSHADTARDERLGLGKTALLVCLRSPQRPADPARRLQCFRLLLPASSLRVQDGLGQSALHLALREKWREGMAELVAGSDLGQIDAWGKTALLLAAETGRDELIQAMLPGSDLRARDFEGRNALMLAAAGGHARCVDLLLPWLDPDERCRRLGEEESALTLAIRKRSAPCVKSLAAASDARSAVSGGQTPLLLAAAGFEEPEALAALARFSDLGAKNAQGQTALMVAARQNPLAVPLLLPFCSAETVNARDARGETALSIAVRAGRAQAVEALLGRTLASLHEANGRALFRAAGPGAKNGAENLPEACLDALAAWAWEDDLADFFRDRDPADWPRLFARMERDELAAAACRARGDGARIEAAAPRRGAGAPGEEGAPTASLAGLCAPSFPPPPVLGLSAADPAPTDPAPASPDAPRTRAPGPARRL